MPSKKVQLKPGDILRYDHNPDFLFEVVTIGLYHKLYYLTTPGDLTHQKGKFGEFSKDFIECNCTKISS